MKKQSEKFTLIDILWNSWLVLLKTFKVIEIKESPKKCYSPEEIGQRNVMRWTGWDTGTEKKYFRERPKKSESIMDVVNNNVSLSVY